MRSLSEHRQTSYDQPPWLQSARAIVINGFSSTGNIESDCQRALQALADTMLRQGAVTAAHVCEVLSSPARLVTSLSRLLGDDLELSEVFEWAVSLSPAVKKAEYAGLPFLQAHRLAKSLQCIDEGHFAEAQRCVSLSVR